MQRVQQSSCHDSSSRPQLTLANASVAVLLMAMIAAATDDPPVCITVSDIAAIHRQGVASHGPSTTPVATSVWTTESSVIAQPASLPPSDDVINGPLPPVRVTMVLSPRECDALIAAAEEAAEARGGWETRRHVRAATTDISVWDNPALRQLVTPLVTAKAHEVPGLFGTGPVEFSDVFVVRYMHDATCGGGNDDHDCREKTRAQAELELHQDSSVVTLQVALSSGEGVDFSGGGTYFAAYNCTLSLHKGEGALFPGQLWHAGNRITSGTRYMLVGFSQSGVGGGGDDVDAVTPSDFGALPYRVALGSVKRDIHGDCHGQPTLESASSPPLLRVGIISARHGGASNSTGCHHFRVRYTEKDRQNGGDPLGLIWLYNRAKVQENTKDPAVVGVVDDGEEDTHGCTTTDGSVVESPFLTSGVCVGSAMRAVDTELSCTPCQFVLDESFVSSHSVILMLLPPRHEFTSFALKPSAVKM